MSIFPVQGQRDSPRPFEEESQQKRGVTNVARSKFNLVAHQLCDLGQVFSLCLSLLFCKMEYNGTYIIGKMSECT